MMYRAFGATDEGRVRDVNEDNLLVVTPPDEALGLFVVADGAGGAAHGDVASRLFVDELRRYFDAERDRFAAYELADDQALRKPLVELLVSLMNRAGNAVFELSQHRRAMSGMCTTATVLVLCNGGAFLGHVGDGRAYLIREGVTYRLTEDHTWANELAQQCDLSPGQIPSAPYGHVVTRTFGFAPKIDVDTLFFPLRPADRIVLCTDGLHRYVRGKEIEALSPTLPAAQGLADSLVQRSLERGGEDNVSVVVVDALQDDGVAAPGPVGFHQQVGLLRNLFLFEFLNDQEVMRVMRIVYQQQRAAGEHIIEEGTEGREIFVVVQGSVEVSVKGEPLTTIGVGGHFGELALIDHQVRSATVTAKEDVTLLTIDHQDFYGLVRSEHSLASKLLWSFLKNVAGRVRELSDEVAQLSRAAPQR
ncbi:MAG: protein phosphatase 2C domain-containing protein [Deltaproteobacteria bacterium]|jgi:serine/threonine protein phosphatase PrpC|nr:protein phosphatase 2C domain-containing protein [Deltaproteobacteria bacterium]MBW2533463.1 protein phosphatase 2C domain-containing protein [Deltaproteobacteria bacterium]